MSNNKINFELDIKSDNAVNNLEKVDKSFKKINKDFDGFGKRTKKEIETGLAALLYILNIFYQAKDILK
ncbi:hypothetical protein [uncultured Brachyspira sp.]|uniref:hypothetical protein n=1 Tax=uncultured Brachyspira sp. TaxID=221953 RepID=UPI002583C94C|nr:hypothetical protein [uncultured Brachyspira sp.]